MDPDLQCFQKRIYPGSAGQGLIRQRLNTGDYNVTATRKEKISLGR